MHQGYENACSGDSASAVRSRSGKKPVHEKARWQGSYRAVQSFLKRIRSENRLTSFLPGFPFFRLRVGLLQRPSYCPRPCRRPSSFLGQVRRASRWGRVLPWAEPLVSGQAVPGLFASFAALISALMESVSAPPSASWLVLATEQKLHDVRLDDVRQLPGPSVSWLALATEPIAW